MKKKKWSKVLSVFLVMVTAVSLLSGCGGKSAEKEDAETITVYLWSTKLYEKYEINTGIGLFANMRKVCAEYTPAAPVTATGWYLPSHGEFNILNEQKTLLDTALSAVEGESVWSGITEYGYAFVMGLVGSYEPKKEEA